MFEELDVIELTHDIKSKSLKEGEKGTIVNIYNDGEAYEVEFVEPSGRTKALLTLMPEDILIMEDKGLTSYFSTAGTVSDDFGLDRAKVVRTITESSIGSNFNYPTI